MRVAWLGVFLIGCFQPTSEIGDAGVGETLRCFYSRTGASVCAEPADIRACGDQTCRIGTQCCLTTGSCDEICDPGDAGTELGDGQPCGSSLDCGPDEYCAGPNEACFGAGRCQPLRNCAVCEASDSTRCEVCGCDGKTYPSPQAACAAGVRALTGSCSTPATGDGACVAQSQCGPDMFCCLNTNRCVSNSEAWRCKFQDDGGAPHNCASDDDCQDESGYPWTSQSTIKCIGSGCTGPGYCRVVSTPPNCGGEYSPVCGCNEQTYINACHANAAGIRVRMEGSCAAEP